MKTPTKSLALIAVTGSLAAMSVPAQAADMSAPTQITTEFAASPLMALTTGADYAGRDREDDDRRYRRGRGRYDDRVYDNRGRYREPRRIRDRDRIWRGRDGNYYCKRDNGTTGLVIGAGVGALLGRTVDTRGDRTVGTLLGGALGAVIGREIDRGDVRCR